MVTALSLLGYDVKRFAHLDLEILCPSSPQTLSNSVSIDEECHFHFQVSHEMFDCVQVRTLTGPIKEIHSFPRPPLHCLGSVLRVIVLLEGEPSAQAEILSSLNQVFFKDISVLCSVQLP